MKRSSYLFFSQPNQQLGDAGRRTWSGERDSRSELAAGLQHLGGNVSHFRVS